MIRTFKILGYAVITHLKQEFLIEKEKVNTSELIIVLRTNSSHYDVFLGVSEGIRKTYMDIGSGDMTHSFITSWIPRKTDLIFIVWNYYIHFLLLMYTYVSFCFCARVRDRVCKICKMLPNNFEILFFIGLDICYFRSSLAAWSTSLSQPLYLSLSL